MKNRDLYQYTLMPAHMTKHFTVEELKRASLVAPFDSTKGGPLLRIAHRSKANTKTHSYSFPEKMEDTNTVLFDLDTDPAQATPIRSRISTSQFIIDPIHRMPGLNPYKAGIRLGNCCDTSHAGRSFWTLPMALRGDSSIKIIRFGCL